MSVKLGKYGRSVSIIGVGATPFMRTYDNPETEGYTENEFSSNPSFNYILKDVVIIDN